MEATIAALQPRSGQAATTKELRRLEGIAKPQHSHLMYASMSLSTPESRPAHTHTLCPLPRVPVNARSSVRTLRTLLLAARHEESWIVTMLRFLQLLQPVLHAQQVMCRHVCRLVQHGRRRVARSCEGGCTLVQVTKGTRALGGATFSSTPFAPPPVFTGAAWMRPAPSPEPAA